jgi:hypothetical protein
MDEKNEHSVTSTSDIIKIKDKLPCPHEGSCNDMSVEHTNQFFHPCPREKL